MAAPKPPYDPVKTIEGMFNGSLIQIASVFKNPATFGPDTKQILSETSKRFQDALDDCEIQILEAKWYLEYQLAQNKARRDARAQEEAMAAKRKLDEMMQDGGIDGEMELDSSTPKRQKIEEGETEDISDPNQKVAGVGEQNKIVDAKNATKNSSEDKTVPPVEVKLTIPNLDPSNQTAPSTSEGFPKSTPQDTPANEPFNFESMFGEPSADGGDDINFDLDLDPDSFGSNLNLDDPSSLNSLLPGVESYANQTGNGTVANLDGVIDPHPGTSSGNNFNPPELPNEFDSLLEDNNFGSDLNGFDDIINDGSMLDPDSLDKFFT